MRYIKTKSDLLFELSDYINNNEIVFEDLIYIFNNFNAFNADEKYSYADHKILEIRTNNSEDWTFYKHQSYCCYVPVREKLYSYVNSKKFNTLKPDSAANYSTFVEYKKLYNLP